MNASLDSHARIACALIVKDEWSSANGLVTHTMKIKRAAIEQRYLSQAEQVFNRGASTKDPLIVWESTTGQTADLQA